jgi:hypothetical protein
MKTKDLIKKLQEEDPTGEEHVVVDNLDISFISKEPAYYDGAAQMIIRDEKRHAISGKYLRNGHKIQIHTIDFNTLLWDHKDFTMDYSELDPERQKSYRENHDKVRDAAKNFDYQMAVKDFEDWFVEKASKLVDAYDDMRGAAKAFFDANLTPYDKIPADIPIIGESYVSRRKIQWDREIDVSYSENGFCIKKKEK